MSIFGVTGTVSDEVSVNDDGLSISGDRDFGAVAVTGTATFGPREIDAAGEITAGLVTVSANISADEDGINSAAIGTSLGRGASINTRFGKVEATVKAGVQYDLTVVRDDDEVVYTSNLGVAVDLGVNVQLGSNSSDPAPGTIAAEACPLTETSK